jgi:phosphopantothenoylcysteine decarboxylase / phosphopantothenate---cysteine ligase
MENPIKGKRVILGVTGSIACYKAADLASKLAQHGALVEVILTDAAQQFVTPLTFQSVTGRRAYIDADLWGQEGHVQHIALGHQADLVLVAPATANTLAKFAHGIADNLLSVTALAARCTLVVAPAMDGGMYLHPATQANLETLQQRGAIVLGPAQGHLASGQVGVGRMVEPSEILGQVRYLLSRAGPLAPWNFLVTAGGTEEAIDPVRFISNRSSGKQGFALAQAALDQGAEVTLVSGPTALPTPPGARRVDVRSAQEMLAAVMERLPHTDALLMAAAVADFRPAQAAQTKIKKEAGARSIALELNPDILAEVARARETHPYPGVVVGFAAESRDLLQNARLKLAAKKLDLIAANDISAPDAGFNVDTNRVSLLDPSGFVEALPLMTKLEVADRVLARVSSPLQALPILHICPRQAWAQAQSVGMYQPDSLGEAGFIHFSRARQVLQSANQFYPARNDLVVLWVNPQRLDAQLKWEKTASGWYPHLYGALNLDAVAAVTSLEPDADGCFRSLAQPG